MTIRMKFTAATSARAFATLMLATTAITATPTKAATEPPLAKVSAPELAQEPEVRTFAIPAQPLAAALARYSDVTGVSFAYKTGDFSGIRSPGVRGNLTAAQALGHLLAGTGVTFEFTGERTVALNRARESAVTAMQAISVYGSKSVQSLNDVTSSVGIVKSEEIEKRNLTSFREAFRVLGNVNDSDWPDSGFVIRGINSEGMTPGGTKPLATLYVDGTPQTVYGARRGARGLWDVEQIEVYRGPQSTLSGRAALAGAIYLKTADPSFDWEGAANMTIGTMNTRGGAIMVNAPVIEDQVAMRLSAQYESSESDLNYPDYEDFDRFDEFVTDQFYQIRGKVLFLPAALPDTSAVLSYSYSHDSPNTNDIGGANVGHEYGERRGDFNSAVFAESRSADTQNISFEIKHDLIPELELTSLTTYSFTAMERPSVNESTAGEANFTQGANESFLASQELRANLDSGPWRVVAGVFASIEEDQNHYRRPANFNRSDYSESYEKVVNMAAFGEVAYEFLPTWQIVGGGRVDHTDQNNANYFTRNGAVRTNTRTSFDELVFLPKIGLVKDLSPDQTVAFTVQKGFRSGGAGVQTSTGRTFSYDAEFAWNYELSYKGSFLNDRLQLTANAFYMQWKDQQVEIQEDPNDGNSDYTTNAANSSVMGFEVESQYAVTKEVSTFASIGYSATEFEEFNDQTYGDLGGFPFPQAPRWNLAFGTRYEDPTGFFIGGDAKYVSHFLARFGNAPQEYLDGYWVANVQAGFRNETWQAVLYVENALANDYFTYHDRNTTEDIAATLGPRRVFGVSVTGKF